ncbi:hypothetical protein [Serratia sp. DD3]|nr:hypothetical protein [Serratia sp. DD3]KEY57148.1 hypothetical protein SRDD_39660 [Serratia sp. DD3]
MLNRYLFEEIFSAVALCGLVVGGLGIVSARFFSLNMLLAWILFASN